MTDELTDQQMLRYSRQILIPAFDLEGQEILLQSRVLVVGLGGLGSPAALYLAAAGVGQLTLVDDDQVELSNLQRQILHREQAIGEPKATSAASTLAQLNSELALIPLAIRPDEAELVSLCQQHDLVLDCTDSRESRNQLNRACHLSATPLISAAAIRMEGQLMVFDMQPGSPCYACYSQFFPEQELSCVESGILAPVVGVMGTLQAVEAIKLLTGVGEVHRGILIYDAMAAAFRQLGLPKSPDCPVCGGQ